MIVSPKGRLLDKINIPFWNRSYIILLLLFFVIIFTVYQLLSYQAFQAPSLAYILVAAMLIFTITLMSFGLFKKNISYIWWEALLLAYGFCGIWILSLTLIPGMYGALVAALITLMAFFWPLVIWHNIIFLLGTVGLGLFVSMQFPFAVLLVCSACVALYEYQRKDKFEMATLYSEAWSVGLPPGFLIPSETIGWFEKNQITWQAGKGVVVGFLPFIIMSAIALRLLNKGIEYFVILVLIMIFCDIVWGQGKDARFRSWLFPAISSILYAISGLLIYFL